MAEFSWYTDDKPHVSTYLNGEPKKRYLVVDGIAVVGRAVMNYKPPRKGGHRHNAIYNAFHRIVFRSKNARQIDPKTKQEFREIFEMQVFGGMDPWNRINFLDILKKGKHFKQLKK